MEIFRREMTEAAVILLRFTCYQVCAFPTFRLGKNFGLKLKLSGWGKMRDVEKHPNLKCFSINDFLNNVGHILLYNCYFWLQPIDFEKRVAKNWKKKAFQIFFGAHLLPWSL